MIISKIIGGLGNQMFQHAAGRALSLRYGVKFGWDTRSFKNYNLHNGFELENIFGLNVSPVSRHELFFVLGLAALPGFEKLLKIKHIKNSYVKNLILEENLEFNNKLFNFQENAYLDGYWQSEKYFSDFSSEIIKDFKFVNPLNSFNEDYRNKILSCNSVSLHIRRGDYLKNPSAYNFHGVCSIEYYNKAMRIASEKIINPIFFVFSDDINWALENFKGDNIFFVNINSGSESYNDMRLMSQCNINIISNSSFSWWAAWLNRNPGKIVIAPEKWYAGRSTPSELIPSSWIKI